MSTKIILCLLLIMLALAPHSDAQQWRVNSSGTKQISELHYTLQVGFTDEQTHSQRFVKTDSTIAIIDGIYTLGRKAAVLGRTGEVQVVEILDILSGTRIDWFYCYQPQFLGSHWIAFVQYYPQHGGGSPTDVVRLYDLRENAVANHYRVPLTNPKYPSQRGTAIYPVSDATIHYDTQAPSEEEAIHVLGPPYFGYLSSNRLVFLAARGGTFDTLRNYLVVVDLSADDAQGAKVSEVALPFSQLKRSGVNPSFLKVLKIQELSPFRVLLVLPPSEYGLRGDTRASVIVEIPPR